VPTLLNETSVTEALAGLDGWSGDPNGLHRTVELADFPTAISAVDSIARVAEEMDHPDIDIRWRTLTFACATHSEGGVTELDVALAGRINEIITGL
jgi:4a-hydroxytetrahydrobiopterin dehydratase